MVPMIRNSKGSRGNKYLKVRLEQVFVSSKELQRPIIQVFLEHNKKVQGKEPQVGCIRKNSHIKSD